MLTEEILIYGITALFCMLVVWMYIRRGRRVSEETMHKVEEARASGRHEPVSLHPFIDPDRCMGSGACVDACPEKDIIGMVDGRATVINASSCIGHGACFHACPVEAITLRIGTATRGVELPHVNQDYETNVKGIYIAGELGGMGLIRNSVEQGIQAVRSIAATMGTRMPGVTDLVIVGAGPAGIAAALQAKKMGLEAITLEQDSLGGTVFSFPRSKVVMTHPMELPLYGKLKLYDTSKQQLLDIWQDALQKNNIRIREHQKVDSIRKNDDHTFEVLTAAGEIIHCQHVILAIGRRGSPRKLGIPGESLEKVAYRLIEPERLSGMDIAVVGGGDSAVEAALLLMDANRVTLSYRKDAFARIKPGNELRIREAMDAKKLEVLFNSELTEITTDGIMLQIKGVPDPRTMRNDLVYIFAGGELPNAFLSAAGIEITKRFGQIVKKH
jgi:thioredoxin reductase/NAD-dependent dihydropyrimidine dehydrogenase PreA subunit